MPLIRQANPLSVPDSHELRFLPEGPMALEDNLCSWVGIQHGKTATTGSLNLYDLSTGVNRSFDLPGRPGFAFACETRDKFIVGCERSLGVFDTASKAWQPLVEGVDSDVENTIINDGIVTFC